MSEFGKNHDRCGRQMEEKEETEWIRRALEIDKARAMMLSNTDLSSNFVGFGGVNDIHTPSGKHIDVVD